MTKSKCLQILNVRWTKRSVRKHNDQFNRNYISRDLWRTNSSVHNIYCGWMWQHDWGAEIHVQLITHVCHCEAVAVVVGRANYIGHMICLIYWEWLTKWQRNTRLNSEPLRRNTMYVSYYSLTSLLITKLVWCHLWMVINKCLRQLTSSRWEYYIFSGALVRVYFQWNFRKNF